MEDFKKKTAAVADQLRKIRIVPVLAIEDVEDGIKVCEILNNCGLKAAEITFRTKAAVGIIKAVAERMPDMLVGAGTVLNVEDLKRAQDAGSKFAVAPGCNPTIIKEAMKLGLPFMPGIATPSEIELALETGVTAMKFFPAESLGGIAMLKGISAPYKHLGVQFMPTGGVSLKNVKDYLDVKEIFAVGGTWLAKPEAVKAKDWAAIEKTVQEAVAFLKQV